MAKPQHEEEVSESTGLEVVVVVVVDWRKMNHCSHHSSPTVGVDILRVLVFSLSFSS
jgi:hypothetical protein